MAKEENIFENNAPENGGKPAINADKLKALRAAMEKIEKNYGKGSIMKLGDELHSELEVIQKDESLRFTVRNLQVRQHWQSTLLQKLRRLAVSLHSLTQNMLSTVSTQKNLVLMLTIFGFHSRIAVSKLWKLQNSLFVHQLLTS